jgi:capsular exopolysaccharide synthesis family protein
MVQDADEPTVKKYDGQTQAVTLAGFGAFFLVGFCTALWEFRSRRIHGVDEIVDGLGLRLMGTLPALPARVRYHPLAFDETGESRWHNLLNESIDGIRTMLLHDAQQSGTRVLVVTSAVSGEGKTTLSSHLAVSLARAGRKTLLIDGDLKRPAVQELFDLSLQPGLSEVLRGDLTAEAAIRCCADGRLGVMTAGQSDRQALQALPKGVLPRLLESLKLEYDFILIDSGPVLPGATSLLVGQNADGVILSIMRDHSQAPRVYASAQRLAALGIRVIGAVFNKARGDLYGYGYYGYGYGYGAIPQAKASPNGQAPDPKDQNCTTCNT